MSDLYNDCPVKAPKLLKAESLVETCAGCGAWIERYPSFLGEGDSFWQCEKCGSTSVRIREGRAYGAKSREWATIVERFEELYLDLSPQDWDTVQTEPPMQSLDWEAVEQWFRQRGIYRIFINVSVATISVSEASDGTL